MSHHCCAPVLMHSPNGLALRYCETKDCDPWGIPMSIRWKIMILLSVVSVLFAGTTYAVQRLVLVPGFMEIEMGESKDDLARCVEALSRDAEHLSNTANDWGAWDDMYAYVGGTNDAFATVNLIPETFSNVHINLLAVLKPNGERIWGELRDDMSTEPIEVKGFWEELCRADHPLARHASLDSVVSGVVMTSKGAMLVGSRPVITSKHEGPILGSVIMGRLLDDEGVAELAKRTRVDLKFWSIPDHAVPAEHMVAMKHLESAPIGTSWLRDNGLPEDTVATLRGYSIIRDVFDKPALLLRAALPRTIALRGIAAANIATGVSLSGGFALLLLTWLLVQFKIINPLTMLTTHALGIGRDGNLRARLNMKRDDEIGTLAREFDGMVGSLADARAKMMDTARRAGMADVAVEMLHNVGNALNSVNVSAGLVTERLRGSEVASLEKATKLMAAHENDLGNFIKTDERGRQLPGFLKELSTCLVNENVTALEEMKRLHASVEHIRQIVDSQKPRGDDSRMVETAELADILNEAVRLTAVSFAKHKIQILTECDSQGSVEVDRHRLMQILANLLSNAKNAVKLKGGAEMQIRLRADHIAGPHGERFRICISDNGIGIPAENLTRIFAMGFSTRPDGQGYGLHSAANMAREMNGSLSVTSEGAGQGAQFVIDLPVSNGRVNA